MSDMQTVGLVVGGLVFLVVVFRLVKLLLGAAAGLVVTVPILIFQAVILALAWAGALLFALGVNVWAWCRSGVDRFHTRRVARRAERARLRDVSVSEVRS